MPVRDIDIEAILNSKIYVKSGSAVSFKAPEVYLNPFLEALEKDELGKKAKMKVKVADPVVNENTSGERNIAYPRVVVEAELGELVPNFQASVGFVYALDLQKPIIKTYSGFNLMSCTNLHILNTDNLHQVELMGNYESAYQKAEKFIAEKTEDILDFREKLSKLQDLFLTEKELNELIGRMLREAPKTRLGTTPILGATKLLDDRSSVYYVRPDGKFECNLHKVYNAVTQILSDSNDILDKPLKTVQLTKLILN